MGCGRWRNAALIGGQQRRRPGGTGGNSRSLAATGASSDSRRSYHGGPGLAAPRSSGWSSGTTTGKVTGGPGTSTLASTAVTKHFLRAASASGSSIAHRHQVRQAPAAVSAAQVMPLQQHLRSQPDQLVAGPALSTEGGDVGNGTAARRTAARAARRQAARANWHRPGGRRRQRGRRCVIFW